MQQQAKQEIMTVMLDNMVQQTLPRTFAIRQKLERGEVLLSSEIEFFMEMLESVKKCQRDYIYDAECKVIFTTVAHLLYQTANMAMKNEKIEP